MTTIDPFVEHFLGGKGHSHSRLLALEGLGPPNAAIATSF
jgi:hypothetical protein